MSQDVTDLVGYRFDLSSKSWQAAFFMGAFSDAAADAKPEGHYELLGLDAIKARKEEAVKAKDRDAVLEYNTAASAIEETVAGLRTTPNDLPSNFQDNLYTAANDELFKVIDPRADVDWSDYVIAQKTAKVKAEFVGQGTRVDTIMANGLHETSKTAGPDGGYKVTAQTGEQYLVDKAKFEKIYDETSDPGIYAPKPDPRKVLELDRNVAFNAPWGEPMRIRAGGVLVNGGKGDVYGIQPPEFKASYSFG